MKSEDTNKDQQVLTKEQVLYKRAIGFFQTNTKVHFQKLNGAWGNGYIVTINEHFFVIEEEEDGEKEVFFHELEDDSGLVMFRKKEEVKGGGDNA